MRVRISGTVLLPLLSLWADAFAPANRVARRSSFLFASTQQDEATVVAAKPTTQGLGLLTFDLDDTLYPIDPVVAAANGTSNIEVNTTNSL